jgi:hypothetical protein
VGELRKETDREKDERLKHLLFKGAPMPIGWKLPLLVDPPTASDPSAVERAKQEIETLKNASFDSWERQPFEAGVMAAPGMQGRWDQMTEWGKLDTMQHWVNLEGVSQRDRASLILSHLNPDKLSPDVRDQIVHDASGHSAPAVPTPDMPEPEY